MVSEAINLSHNDYNKDTRRWNVGLLNVANSVVTKIEKNGATVSDDLYSIVGSYIQFDQGYSLDEEDKILAFIEIDNKKTKTQFNTTLAVAIIGLLGTIFPFIYPDFKCWFKECETTADDLVIFQGPEFGINDATNEIYYTMGHKSVLDSHSIVDLNRLNKSKLWVAQKTRDGMDISQHYFKHGAAGPFTYRTGGKLEVKIKPEVCLEAVTSKKYIQGVVIMADPSLDLSKPFTPSNHDGLLQVIKVPGMSVESEAECS